MSQGDKVPKYAVRLVALIVGAAIVFFGGLELFVPAGSRLTGSYDAQSLLYIAAAPVAYQGSASCGASNCHALVFKKWSAGAHGARQEQSKCEVCHGPQGNHPQQNKKQVLVRGDGDIVQLCLTCHRRMKARATTGQPQIVPQQHPYPHQGVLKCTQCHDPHSPGFTLPAGKDNNTSTAESAATGTDKGANSPGAALASNCYGCHGPSGRGGFAPVLAGQPYEALKDKLTRFRSGEVTSMIMNPIAAELKDKEIEALARFFENPS